MAPSGEAYVKGELNNSTRWDDRLHPIQRMLMVRACQACPYRGTIVGPKTLLRDLLYMEFIVCLLFRVGSKVPYSMPVMVYVWW